MSQTRDRDAIIEDCTEKQREHAVEDLHHTPGEAKVCLNPKDSAERKRYKEEGLAIGFHPNREEAEEQEMAIKTHDGSIASRLAMLEESDREALFQQPWVQGGLEQIVAMVSKMGGKSEGLIESAAPLFFAAWDNTFKYIDGMLQRMHRFDTSDAKHEGIAAEIAKLSLLVTSEAIFDAFDVDSGQQKIHESIKDQITKVFRDAGRQPPPPQQILEKLVAIAVESSSQFMESLADEAVKSIKTPVEEDEEMRDIEDLTHAVEMEEPEKDRAKASDVLPPKAEYGDMAPQHSDRAPKHYLSPTKKVNPPLAASVRDSDVLRREDFDTLFETQWGPKHGRGRTSERDRRGLLKQRITDELLRDIPTDPQPRVEKPEETDTDAFLFRTFEDMDKPAKRARRKRARDSDMQLHRGSSRVALPYGEGGYFGPQYAPQAIEYRDETKERVWFPQRRRSRPFHHDKYQGGTFTDEGIYWARGGSRLYAAILDPNGALLTPDGEAVDIAWVTEDGQVRRKIAPHLVAAVWLGEELPYEDQYTPEELEALDAFFDAGFEGNEKTEDYMRYEHGGQEDFVEANVRRAAVRRLGFWLRRNFVDRHGRIRVAAPLREAEGEHFMVDLQCALSMAGDDQPVSGDGTLMFVKNDQGWWEAEGLEAPIDDTMAQVLQQGCGAKTASVRGARGYRGRKGLTRDPGLKHLLGLDSDPLADLLADPEAVGFYPDDEFYLDEEDYLEEEDDMLPEPPPLRRRRSYRGYRGCDRGMGASRGVRGCGAGGARVEAKHASARYAFLPQDRDEVVGLCYSILMRVDATEEAHILSKLAFGKKGGLLQETWEEDADETAYNLDYDVDAAISYVVQELNTADPELADRFAAAVDYEEPYEELAPGAYDEGFGDVESLMPEADPFRYDASTRRAYGPARGRKSLHQSPRFLQDARRMPRSWRDLYYEEEDEEGGVFLTEEDIFGSKSQPREGYDPSKGWTKPARRRKGR